MNHDAGGHHDRSIICPKVLIGVEETFYEHIFDPFVQVDMTVSKRFGGTGLGLSIVKKLVEFMGGTVGVQSQATGGSIFELLLPFDK